MTPRASSDQRRAQIVRGLIKTMASHGYERSSIQAIARAASLSPGLIHYHFQSKQDILAALADELERGLRLRYQRALEALSTSATPRGLVRAFIQAHVSLDHADPDAVACWVALAHEAAHQPEVRTIYERIIAADIAQLDTLITLCGVYDPLRRRHVCATLYAAICGAYQLAISSPSSTPQGWAEPMLIELATALLPPEAPAR
jgi:TetR/AcrR family transcriptional repressor of bet genes